MLDRTTAVAPTSAPALRRRPGHQWTKREIAQFGYFVGKGLTGPDIMDVLDISSTAAVANACTRYGLTLAHRRNGDRVVSVVVTKAARAGLDEAAAVRGLTRAALIEKLVNTIGEIGPEYAGEVLDDGIEDFD